MRVDSTVSREVQASCLYVELKIVILWVDQRVPIGRVCLRVRRVSRELGTNQDRALLTPTFAL